MRLRLLAMMLLLVVGIASAQQHVVRSGIDPRNRSGSMAGTTCVWAAYGNPFAVGDPCDVSVYDVSETQSHIDTAISGLRSELNQTIDKAKTDLANDLNNIPSSMKDALTAQIKDQLKTEILEELKEEIKAGKLKQMTEPSQK